MKKFLALLLAMMLILSSFAACGSSDDAESADPGVNAGQDVEAGGEELEDGAEEGTEGEAGAEGTGEEDADKEESNEEASDKQEEQTPADKPASSGDSNTSSSKPSSSGNTSSSGKSEAKAPSGTPAEIIDKIYAEYPVADFPLGTIELDLSDVDALKMFTGLSSADKIESAAASEAMMGSQAYSLVVVKVKKEKDAETVLEEMVNGIDQRKWICVEADDLSAATVGNVVVLMMVDSEYAATVTSKNIIDAFSKVCGGLDTRI